jgi:uncharacterized protein
MSGQGSHCGLISIRPDVGTDIGENNPAKRLARKPRQTQGTWEAEVDAAAHDTPHTATPVRRAYLPARLAASRSKCDAAPTQTDTRCMDENVPLFGPIDLDALDDYLMSDHAPDDCMGLSDLDGFLTGIVVGPELILASEWLPIVWGGDEPVFETEDEMRTVLGTIFGRYNELGDCFNTNPAEFEPIFLEGPEGEVIASDWAGGFLDAVALRPEAWEPLIQDHLGGLMMMPFLRLTGDDELDAGPDGAVHEDEFMAEAADIIRACIAGIHEFWTSHRGTQTPPPRRGRSRPGGRRRR